LKYHNEDFYHESYENRQDALKNVKDLIEEITGEDLPFNQHLVSSVDIHIKHLTDKEKEEVKCL